MMSPLIAKEESVGNNQLGIATLEMLIAMSLMVLVISAVLPLVWQGQSLPVDSQTEQEALYKALTLLENERAAAKMDFNLVNPVAQTTDGIYQKAVNVSQVDFYTKKVTSNLGWTEGGRNLTASLSTLITNPTGYSSGNTCSSILSGNWKNPQKTDYEFGKDIVGDASSGFPITDVQAHENKLYVTVNNSNGNNSPTFFVLDISNPAIKPPLLASVDNDPTVKAGLNAVAVSGNYAYVANGNNPNFATCTTCGQLQVFDISVSTPVLKTTFKVPGVTGKNGQSIGSSIFYSNGYVYLGLAKTLSGSEFNVIDVGGGGLPASPTNPVWKGGYPVGNAVNKIFVKNNVAYLATPNTENLTLVDVNVASSTFMQRIAGYSPAGGSNGEAVTVIGNRTYLGRTFGSNEFYILDTSTPSGGIPVIASKDIGTGSDNSINDIVIRDSLAFLITNAKFEVWNISDTANIVPWTTSGSSSDFLDLPGGSGTAIGCEGNYLYVGSLPASNKGYISIITSGP